MVEVIRLGLTRRFNNSRVGYGPSGVRLGCGHSSPGHTRIPWWLSQKEPVLKLSSYCAGRRCVPGGESDSAGEVMDPRNSSPTLPSPLTCPRLQFFFPIRIWGLNPPVNSGQPTPSLDSVPSPESGVAGWNVGTQPSRVPEPKTMAAEPHSGRD